jgi:hypothetical protein
MCEVGLAVALDDDGFEVLTALTRRSNFANHDATECNWVTLNSLLERLSIRLAWTFSGNENLHGINESGVGEAFDEVLATDIDDVREAHDPILDGTEIDVAGLEEAFQRCNEGVVVGRIVEGKPTDEGCDTGTVEQLQDNGGEVSAVVFAGDIVKRDQCGLEFQLTAALVAGNPMGGNAEVRAKILVRPEVCGKANLPDSVGEFEPQGLEVGLPGLDNGLTQLGAVGDVFVLKVGTKQEEEIPKLPTLDDVDRLIIRNDEVDQSTNEGGASEDRTAG